jgi:hypothetical protein
MAGSKDPAVFVFEVTLIAQSLQSLIEPDDRWPSTLNWRTQLEPAKH